MVPGSTRARDASPAGAESALLPRPRRRRASRIIRKARTRDPGRPASAEEESDGSAGAAGAAVGGGARWREAAGGWRRSGRGNGDGSSRQLANAPRSCPRGMLASSFESSPRSARLSRSPPICSHSRIAFASAMLRYSFGDTRAPVSGLVCLVDSQRSIAHLSNVWPSATQTGERIGLIVIGHTK
eukprot:3804144-Prymnesium_polylepis.1